MSRTDVVVLLRSYVYDNIHETSYLIELISLGNQRFPALLHIRNEILASDSMTLARHYSVCLLSLDPMLLSLSHKSEMSICDGYHRRLMNMTTDITSVTLACAERLNRCGTLWTPAYKTTRQQSPTNVCGLSLVPRVIRTGSPPAPMTALRPEILANMSRK